MIWRAPAELSNKNILYRNQGRHSRCLRGNTQDEQQNIVSTKATHRRSRENTSAKRNTHGRRAKQSVHGQEQSSGSIPKQSNAQQPQPQAKYYVANKPPQHSGTDATSALQGKHQGNRWTAHRQRSTTQGQHKCIAKVQQGYHIGETAPVGNPPPELSCDFAVHNLPPVCPSRPCVAFAS